MAAARMMSASLCHTDGMKKKLSGVTALLAATLVLSAGVLLSYVGNGASPGTVENSPASSAVLPPALSAAAAESVTAAAEQTVKTEQAAATDESRIAPTSPAAFPSAVSDRSNAFIAASPAREKDGGKTVPAAAGEKVRLPILMYHSVLRSRKGVYVVSPAQLEADLAALCRAGYTPVRAEAVIAYAEGRGELPEKPVLLTFDDGHYNSWYYAAPLLKKYGASAVFSVVGKYTDFSTGGERDNPNYSYLTWDEIAAMRESREAEIGNHTYAMHEMHPRFGAGRMEGESDEHYAAALRADIGKMQTALCEKSGTETAIFAYPFGKYNCVSRKVLCEMGFRMILTCNEGVSTVRRGDPSSLLSLCRFNRCGRVSTAHMMREITEGRYFPPGECGYEKAYTDKTDAGRAIAEKQKGTVFRRPSLAYVLSAVRRTVAAVVPSAASGHTDVL